MFKDCLDKCNMIDIGFSRPRFTWTNRREVKDLIQERIDRFFVNPSWCLVYPDARVVHLTRCHSDHCPVLLELHPRRSNSRKRPFKFQTCWLIDVSFPKIVAQAWGSRFRLEDAIRKFEKDATTWNRMQFGNIFSRKKNIMVRLNGIQRAVSINPSAFLLNLENELLKDLDIVLKQEEELWALKSQVSWMVQGDRNTAFYHLLTLVRRKRNLIMSIKDSAGEWISEENATKEFIRKGFEDIYITSLSSACFPKATNSQWQPRLTEEEKESISGIATEEEIKATLWTLKPFKAPGPDDLHAGFFQRFWLIVGKLVMEEIKKIFSERRVPEYLNKTHIALIPRIQGPETLGNYRPISLCNSVYKVVTKIIVARLRPFMGNLISPLQTEFVPGRKGVDNAIIAQEIIHSLGKKKGQVGYMALKIDLEKAYDKIEWSFIKEMMVRVNLPTNLIDIIMSCVSTVLTSILINRETTNLIFPSRGLRQGDSLSPYLFILCMDYLSQLIGEKCEAKHWHPVKTSQNGPAFSHLLFADNLLFFAKADIQNSLAIREVLDDFCSISGQSISEAKSRVYFSPNVSRELREELGDIIEFASIPTLGKYLGFPLKQVGTSSHDYNFILDRVKQKLTSWKANVLSMASRSVLIQASLTAIPAHVMQCSYLPGRILEGIDRVNRNFLWGSSELDRKIHWVGWKKVVKSN